MKLPLSLIVVASLAFPAVPALAATTETISTRITVKATASRLKGKVVAPAATGNFDERCEKKRKIEVFMKKPSGFKRIARVTSKADGSWSAPAAQEGKIYKIVMAKKTFAVAPVYGALTDVLCRAKTVRGKKVSSTRFKIL